LIWTLPGRHTRSFQLSAQNDHYECTGFSLGTSARLLKSCSLDPRRQALCKGFFPSEWRRSTLLEDDQLSISKQLHHFGVAGFGVPTTYTMSALQRTLQHDAPPIQEPKLLLLLLIWSGILPSRAVCLYLILGYILLVLEQCRYR
jgi:hypothetical protein